MDEVSGRVIPVMMKIKDSAVARIYKRPRSRAGRPAIKQAKPNRFVGITREIDGVDQHPFRGGCFKLRSDGGEIQIPFTAFDRHGESGAFLEFRIRQKLDNILPS